MAEPPRSLVPRGLDRAALERVLTRAAELQATSADSPEELTEAQIVDLGKEVGISATHVRQALAEERTRTVVQEETGLLAKVSGPARVMASRTIVARPEQVMAALDEHMQREECLQVRRRFPDRMTWEARRDLVGNIKRGFNIGGRGYHLTRAREIGATLIPVDDKQLLVHLDADVGNARTHRVQGAVGSVAAGGAVGGTLAILGFVTVAIVPFVAVGAAYGWYLVRSHREVAAQVQVALEQVLDQLEQGSLRSRASFLDVLSTVRTLRP